MLDSIHAFLGLTHIIISQLARVSSRITCSGAYIFGSFYEWEHGWSRFSGVILCHYVEVLTGNRSIKINRSGYVTLA